MLRRIVRKLVLGKHSLQTLYLMTGEFQRAKNRRIEEWSQRVFIQSRIDECHPFFASIKGMYAGRRGFVIGNGPSLRLEDLERIKNEISLAANKVYLAFEKVSWRPSFLTIADPLVWQKVQDEIWKHYETVLIPSYLAENPSLPRKAKIFRHLGEATDSREPSTPIYFSDDLCKGAFGGHTVTYENLQLAVHLGLNPIYIIGCDHFYKGEAKMDPDTSIEAGNVSNHFIAGYRVPGEIVKNAPIEEMNISYAQARTYCDANGIKIINATRGGYLEIFERANFDDLFGD